MGVQKKKRKKRTMAFEGGGQFLKLHQLDGSPGKQIFCKVRAHRDMERGSGVTEE